MRFRHVRNGSFAREYQINNTKIPEFRNQVIDGHIIFFVVPNLGTVQSNWRDFRHTGEV
jgi:hypothetical protein